MDAMDGGVPLASVIEPVLRLYGTVEDSIVDGPGLRYSIFVQGCAHGCPGCHNPESQPYEGGESRTVSELYDDIHANGLVQAVTFSGGEPFDQAAACAALAARLKADGFNIWAYSGYLYEDLLRLGESDPAIIEFLGAVDVLVDGPFVEPLKSMLLDWKGSSNQRLIDVPKSREAGHVVEWRSEPVTYEKPPSW